MTKQEPTMQTYRVQLEISADGQIWQAQESFDTEARTAQAAAEVADPSDLDLNEGAKWRVHVYEIDEDGDTDLVLTWYPHFFSAA